MQAAVTRQYAGEEYKGHSEAHTLHLHLAQAYAHGADQGDKQQRIYIVGHAERIV